MRGSSITGTVTTPVVLGRGGYPSPLTITATGEVNVLETVGAAGITGTRAGDAVFNRGVVSGAEGTSDYPAIVNGGAGIDFQKGGRIVNSGRIVGGNGGGGGNILPPSSGGDGVDLGGGTLRNSGSITGGIGGDAPVFHDDFGGAGGAGLVLDDAAVSVANTGTISGGSAGGSGGGAAGVGVIFAASGELDNSGVIAGATSVVVNGGVGIALTGSGTITNQGTIAGGMGGFATYAEGGSGAAGVSISSAGHLLNGGQIIGGAGGLSGQNALGAAGAPGGADVMSDAVAVISNTGTITGGAGAATRTVLPYNSAGIGGIGIDLPAGGGAFNAGLIAGGASGATQSYFSGVTGGAGAVIGAGGTLTNTGTILGGTGGAANFAGYVGGNGGAGVLIDGGTLITAGVVEGGQGGAGLGGAGAAGPAVVFGTDGGTLAVRAGAVFLGDVVGSAAQDDVLSLGGLSAGTLSGLGTSITGFSTIAEENGARWTLNGTVDGQGTIVLGVEATLTLTGTVSIASILFGTGGSDMLTLGDPGDVTSVVSGFGAGDIIELSGVQAASFQFRGDVLRLLDAGGALVDAIRFAPGLHASDFLIRAEGTATDIVYAGAVGEPAAGSWTGGLAGGLAWWCGADGANDAIPPRHPA